MAKEAGKDKSGKMTGGKPAGPSAKMPIGGGSSTKNQDRKKLSSY